MKNGRPVVLDAAFIGRGFLQIALIFLPALLLLFGCESGGGGGMEIAGSGSAPVPIVVASDAPPANREVAEELAGYIEKMSGARPEVVVGNPSPVPPHAIWVGPHPLLETVAPNIDLSFSFPEEILIACDGSHVVVAGRDRMAGETQTEYGTANAVYTFLQKQLGVRRFWPGETGESVLKQDTVRVPVMEFRYHPQFRKRKFWPTQPRDWFQFQRAALDSLQFEGGHAFTEWWDKYHEAHPDYFALQPDGSRDASPDAKNVKIEVANPAVWKQWLDNAEEALRADPAKVMVSASPNDGAMTGETVSAEAKAWDHPDGEKMTLYGKGGAYEAVALTDRYVKFWNILAKGLKERFPDREVFVGAYAYGPYKNPPVEAVLEDNIAIGYVGHFPLAGDELSAKEKAGWKGWADNASQMVFRPNLFHYSGGWLGLPTVSLRRTIEDFRFLAENKCVGLEVDTLPRSWATQGIQFYVMAQLAYDPLQDGQKLLDDYFSRGFGPAAAEVREYFGIMEGAHEAALGRIKHSGGFAKEAIGIFAEIYTPELLEKATRVLDRAARRLEESKRAVQRRQDFYRHWWDFTRTIAVFQKAADKFRRLEELEKRNGEGFERRLDFIRTGLDFTKTQAEIMRTMAKVRESGGKDAEAVRRAIELCKQRDALSAKYPYAVVHAEWYHKARKLDDTMGPPSEEFRRAAEQADAGAVKTGPTPTPTPDQGFD